MVNAFWLDRDLGQAAAWLVDAHVTSSVFECSMALTTAVQLNGHPRDESLYFTHADNPLVRWAATTHENWQYLRDYTEAAHDEWRYRWDHEPDETHKSWSVVESLDREAIADLDWTGDEPSDPPQLTGEWSAPDYVDAYRYYYANDKRDLFRWSKDRTEPPWIEAYALDDGIDVDENGVDERGSSGGDGDRGSDDRDGEGDDTRDDEEDDASDE